MKLHLAEELTLPAEAVTQTFAILGVRGSGKSNTAVLMAEEMFRTKLPFVVIDPVGSWWGLRSSRNGKGPGLAVAIFGGRHGDVPLERAGGALLADLVVDERLSCVLDVSEFSEGDKIRFLIDFAERLYRRNQDPLHLFLEEADDYAPQRPFREQARLLRAWENVVRRGRARGLGITMITQRSAALNKNVLTQIETLLVFRTTSPQDRKAIGAWVDYHGQSQELLESLPGLKDGEAWIWSPHWLGKLLRTRVRLRDTFDSAATPKDVAGRRPPASLADIDLQAIQKRMNATIERAKTEDPRELRRQVAELRQQLVHMKTPVPARVEIKSLEIVKPGMVRRIEQLLRKIEHVIQSADRIQKALAKAAEPIGAVVVNLGTAAARLYTTLQARSDSVLSSQTVLIRERQATPPAGRPAAIKPESELPIGEFRLLTAIAQYPDGVSREQLSVLAGYKRSSRDTYLQRLRERGYFVFNGDQLLATEAGLAMLGSGFLPLPVGPPLQDYWMNRLPVGEAKLLQVLLDAYPKAVDREILSDKTGYKRSSRDTYLQRLLTRRLIVSEGRGAVRAHELLFENRP